MENFSNLQIYLLIHSTTAFYCPETGIKAKDFSDALVPAPDIFHLVYHRVFYFRYSAYFSSLALRKTIPMIPGPVWAPMAQPTWDSMISLH